MADIPLPTPRQPGTPAAGLPATPPPAPPPTPSSSPTAATTGVGSTIMPPPSTLQKNPPPPQIRPLGSPPAPMTPPTPPSMTPPNPPAPPAQPTSPATPAAPKAPGAPGSPGGAGAAGATPGASIAESPTTGAGDKSKKGSAMFANIKQSPFKYLPFAIGGLVVIGLIIFVITRVLGGGGRTQPATTSPKDNTQEEAARKTVPNKQVNLTYWGLWESDQVLATTFQEYEQANPGVKITYVKQSHKDYRERLQTAVASGTGPDVFRYHANWVPMLKGELAAMPQSVMTAAEYKQTFYPVVAEQLQVNGQIVGIPLMYDGLALYYNKEMLKAANAEPPKTWAELKTLASRLTVKTSGTVERGGLAIGTAENVEHFSDILGLLMLQNGADPSKAKSNEVRDALLFYTNFIKVDGVWSATLPSSTVAFARGDAAMMFAPSWRAHEVKAINPSLSFGIASLPKLGEAKLAWSTYWAEGVSAKSGNKDEAWKLLKYLSSKDVQQKLYSAQAGERSFGEMYSRVDLADQLASNELVAPYLQDAPYAKSWYLASYTHDNGINDLLIKYYRDAVNAIVVDGQPIEQVLTTLDQGNQQVLRQYSN